jgi:hypothetical protein
LTRTNSLACYDISIVRKNKSVILNCFSPPVMLATIITESVLTIYTVWRYKMNPLTRLVTATLICLGTFQLAEYYVCTGYGLRAEQWSRLGFVMITALPALGVHILYKLAGEESRKVIYSAYTTMAAFIVFFLTYKPAFIGHQCTGNYVIFQLGNNVGGAYSVYYFGWLLFAIFLGGTWANKFMEAGEKMRTELETVRAMLIGYLVFLVPTALAMTVKPEYRRGIPSIMCGFAVIFAFILVLYILPRASEDSD